MSDPVITDAPPLEGASPFEMRTNQSAQVPEPDIRSALASGDTGFIHSFTTGSTVDGPGVRLVAWTAACMFRCQFCHNPDTWTLSNGMPVTIGQAIDELRKYSVGLRAMGGGFTLSGGEPLMQDRFAVRVFAAAQKLEVHTAIETNGFYGQRLTDDELADIDLVILDMKGFTPEQYQRVAGVEASSRVKAFAQRLAALKRPMWLRYVLVPGLTDVPDEMEQIAAFAASLGVVERAEILPFHQMGKFKWERLGINYAQAETQPPSESAVVAAVELFRSAGLEAF